MRIRRPTTQTSLDLRSNGLRAIWSQLPDRYRSELLSLWTQLIARAAQGASHKKGGTR